MRISKTYMDRQTDRHRRTHTHTHTHSHVRAHARNHREPAKRLGSKSGAAELKKCEFLQDVKWDNIRKMTPP